MLARNDAALAEAPLTPVDVREVIRDVSLELQWLAEARGVHIRQAAPEEPALVSGHRPALHRLFLSLLDNAVKYSARGGDVQASVENSPAGVCVWVRDWGAGIASADLPHIFERFYRGFEFAGRARGDGGHGLGLSLAQSIAKMHGARIEVESREGAGSTFVVRFAKVSSTVVSKSDVAERHEVRGA